MLGSWRLLTVCVGVCLYGPNPSFLSCLQESFTPGQVVWQERDTTSSQFFIVQAGTASLKDTGTGAITSKLGPGKYFGQQSLVGTGQSRVCSHPKLCVWMLT